MLKSLLFLFLGLLLAITRSEEQNGPLNMVTVPTNCPEGQQLVNGVCRDIWKVHALNPNLVKAMEIAERNMNHVPLNMVTVPTNCPEGQQLVNGKCRDIWKFRQTTPIPSRTEETKNNKLEDLVRQLRAMITNHREERQVDFDAEEALQVLDHVNIDRNIISVPNQCPIGYKPDFLGKCRPIFD